MQLNNANTNNVRLAVKVCKSEKTVLLSTTRKKTNTVEILQLHWDF